MALSVSVHLDYVLCERTDLLLQINAAETTGQTVLSSRLIEASGAQLSHVPAEEGIGTRTWLCAEHRLTCDYYAEVEVTRPKSDIAHLDATPLSQLPAQAVRYLLPSRYCQSDDFHTFVTNEFGTLQGGARVAAMRQWIEDNLSYVPGVSNTHTTTLETFAMRQGVCRDFAHLLITLVRASAIPARMASVYAYGIVPEDFHAVVEVFLDGRWHLIDPTGMATADQMIIIGVGSDAADVAFLNSFGYVQFAGLTVSVRHLAKEN